MTVLGFNDNIFTLARRSTDPAVREKAVARLAPWGGTALYDVVIRAVELLGRQTGRRAVVVFTDGDDQSSHASMEAVIQRAEASDATIYMIGQGRAIGATTLQQLMRRLTSVSGGRAFFSEQPSKLEAVFEEILEDLRHQYLLAYPAAGWRARRRVAPAQGRGPRSSLFRARASGIPAAAPRVAVGACTINEPESPDRRRSSHFRRERRDCIGAVAADGPATATHDQIVGRSGHRRRQRRGQIRAPGVRVSRSTTSR